MEKNVMRLRTCRADIGEREEKKGTIKYRGKKMVGGGGRKTRRAFTHRPNQKGTTKNKITGEKTNKIKENQGGRKAILTRASKEAAFRGSIFL